MSGTSSPTFIMAAVPEGKVRMRRKAVAALAAHKQEGLHQLKDDPDEMLRGETHFPHGVTAEVCWEGRQAGKLAEQRLGSPRRISA